MPATATQEPPGELTEAVQLAQDIEREEGEASYQRDNGREDQAASHDEEAAKLREKLEGLQGEAGEPTDKRDPAADAAKAAAADADADALDPETLIVRGLEIPYLKAGGKAPTSGSLKLTGAKAEVEHGTAFKKGTRIHFAGYAVIKKVAAVDKHDVSTGQVTESEQVHEARVVDLVVEVDGE